MAKVVSKVYGDALFDFAKENNCVEKTYEEVYDIYDVLKNNKELYDFLINPFVTSDEKKQVVRNIFYENIWKSPIGKVFSLFHIDIDKGKDEKILNFINIILDKNRAADIINILEYFMDKVREYKNIGLVDVCSAFSLTDEQKNILVEKLKQTTTYNDFVMNYNVDKNLISGMRIQIGDRVIDSTLKTKIENLSKNLRGVRL